MPIIEKLFDKIADAAESGLPALERALDWIANNIDKVIAVAKIAAKVFAAVWIVSNVMTMVNAVRTFGTGLRAASKIASKLSGNVDDVATKGAKLAKLKSAFTTMGSGLSKVGKAAALGAKNFALMAANGLKSALMTLRAIVAEKAHLVATKAQAIATKVMAAVQWALNAAMNANPIGLIVMAIIAAIAVFTLLWNKCAWFRNFWMGLWAGIKLVFTKVWSAIKIAFAVTVGAWKSILSGLKAFFSTIWSGIKFGAQAFLNFFLSIPSRIVSGFQIIGEGIKNIFKAPINFIIDAINVFIRGLNKIKIPDWVPGVGGKGFNINEIPRLASGGFTEGLSFAGEAGQEAVISFDRRYRDQNLAYWARAGAMLGIADESSLLAASGGGGATYNMGGFTFAPQITVSGDMSADDIITVLEPYADKFVDRMERWAQRRERGSYGRHYRAH
jgi:hypothetical protein